MVASKQKQPIIRQVYFYQIVDIRDLWRGSFDAKI